MSTQFAAQRRALIELYIGYFNRAPEQAGLDYWSAQLNQALARGVSKSAALADIADQFYQAGLQFGLYRSDDSLPTFIQTVYRHVLGRAEVDTAGLTYWTQMLASGAVSRGQFVRQIIQEAKDYVASAPADDPFRWVGAYLDNRATVADYFAATSGGLSGAQAIAQGQQIIDQVVSRQAVLAGQTPLEALTHAVRLQQPDVLQVSAVNPGSAAIQPRGAPHVGWLDAVHPGQDFEWRGPTVAISFPDHIPPEHAQDSDLANGWAPVPAAWRGLWFDAIAQALAPIGLQPVLDPAQDQIRIVLGNLLDNVSGWANYPGPGTGGDIRLSTALLRHPEQATSRLGQPDDYISLVLVHELGHALGLKHPHDGPAIMPQALDSQHWSIMSYTHAPDLWLAIDWSYDVGSRIYASNTRYATGIRTDWGVLDLAALMVMYGANPAHQAGDTVYRLAPPSPHTWLYHTISDAGGRDTLDLSALTRPSRIDLRPGTLSDVDVRTELDWKRDLIDQGLAYYWQAGVLDASKARWVERSVEAALQDPKLQLHLWSGLGALGIADGTLLENLWLGPADDIVRDNAVDNHIGTGAGNDTVFLGSGGWDHIDGGPGVDLVVLPSLPAAAITLLPGTGIALVRGAHYGAVLQGVEYLTDPSGAWLAIDAALVGLPPRVPEWMDRSLASLAT